MIATMRLFIAVFAVTFIVVRSTQDINDSAFEHQHERELAVSPYNMFQFVCGTNIYRCGRQVAIPADTECKIRNVQTITSVLTGNSRQCAALVHEARKTHAKTMLYKNSTLCPNSTPTKRVFVSSYAKYLSTGLDGRYCRSRQGCLCCKGADGFGDPHFVTYDGTPYSYHGKCDLVLAQSAEFGEGLGLRVHGRTEIVDSWSRISNAAIRIGNDVIELSNKGSIYFNGVEVKDNSTLPGVMGGSFKIRKDKSMNNIAKMDVIVDVNEGKGKLKMSLFKKIIAVHVGTMVHDLNGMLGNRAVEGLVGRNNTILSTADQMGQHWQVLDTEPMLFHEVRAPQYPETCTMPVIDSRRKLRGLSQQYHRRASEVCAGVTDPHMKQFCVEDVLMTGDVDIAHTYNAEAY